jgi:hypothetical protein
MITIAMSSVIGAPRNRVWDALTDPAEMCRWDPGLISWPETPADPLREGDVLRSRYRVGSLPVQQMLRVVSALPDSRLESDVTLGLFHFRETYLLTDESRTQTRLSLRIAAPNAMPIVGGVVDRFDVRKMAAERVDERLRRVRDWCEQANGPDVNAFA